MESASSRFGFLFSSSKVCNQRALDTSIPLALAFNLKDKEIASVLTYIRNSFGNAAPVTADQVKKEREALSP